MRLLQVSIGLCLFCILFTHCRNQPEALEPIMQISQQFSEYVECDFPNQKALVSHEQATALLQQYLENAGIDSVGIIAEPIFSKSQSAIGRYILYAQKEAVFTALGVWENTSCMRLRIRPITYETDSITTEFSSVSN